MIKPKDLVDTRLTTLAVENTIDHWLILHRQSNENPWPVYVSGVVDRWFQVYGLEAMEKIIARYQKNGWKVTRWSTFGLQFSPAELNLKHQGEK
jgi:hypothetical protein